MKLLLLLTYCAAVLASLDAPFWNDKAVQERGSAVNSTNDGANLGRLMSRDSSEAYQEAERAAGGYLRPNAYYYFMNCAIGSKQYRPKTSLGRWAYSEYGCSHVGLVVGKTAWFTKKFKATYIHIKLFRDGFDQSHHDYTPYESQKLVYGGRTSSSKAKPSRLIEKASMNEFHVIIRYLSLDSYE
ncbi:hypothetical protein LX32DRAFT_654611 [Colletotrichum zoysiae]|uniref:Uncharacterized protein n=1 Tax=Colletotrichum zoysiae TaxID=1216348 RepID=A0AAD9HCY3_9PEZI|nr:hypothetical protein LX32DRAFT_654611 [Colletotrichum zoysiae]